MTGWVEVDWNEGSARWGELTEEQIDRVSEAIVAILGEPDTLE